ncbi:prevent-host-death family protein [Pseudanabaena sp. ABRG5-3]|nr:type II toxin-antitoxin system Phd/YefM family antitoxin [Pseudanabaena sp. ABRG5-3]BBC22943.1 prevent-host-death family protein [Pseudanabaena sp. ABRG5-3]
MSNYRTISWYGDHSRNYGQIVYFVYNVRKRAKAMQIVSATEAKQSFGAVIDKAQREPVMIRKQNRDVAVIMSIEDYQRITRINIQEFQQFRDQIGKKAQKLGLTEDKLNELLNDDQ